MIRVSTQRLESSQNIWSVLLKRLNGKRWKKALLGKTLLGEDFMNCVEILFEST